MSEDQEQPTGSPTSRRSLLAGLALGGAAVTGAVVGGGVASSGGIGFRKETLVLDVACVGSLWRDAPVRNPADEADFRAPFMVEGLIYPAGTIPESGFVPTAQGAIGTWFCQGWLILDNSRPEPHALTHQQFVLGTIDEGQLFPPDTLTSHGLEGTIATSQTATRSVVGGTGAYAGAIGRVAHRTNGFNTSVLADGTDDNAPNYIEEFEFLLPDF
jgi:hypothetical protein